MSFDVHSCLFGRDSLSLLFSSSYRGRSKFAFCIYFVTFYWFWNQFHLAVGLVTVGIHHSALSVSFWRSMRVVALVQSIDPNSPHPRNVCWQARTVIYSAEFAWICPVIVIWAVGGAHYFFRSLIDASNVAKYRPALSILYSFEGQLVVVPYLLELRTSAAIDKTYAE